MKEKGKKYIEPDMRFILNQNSKTKKGSLDIKVDTINGCWNVVNRAPHKDGYYKVRYNGKNVPVRRFIYEKYYGKIPDCIVILPKCGNKECYNPQHLETIAPTDNTQDVVKPNNQTAERQYGEIVFSGAPNAKPLKYEILPNGCYKVVGRALDARGVCNIRFNNQSMPAYRAVYMIYHGDIPRGLVVRHKCDFGGCVNPEHLELGTQADNNRDRIERGRIRVNYINYVKPDIQVPLANNKTLDIKINDKTGCWETVNRIPNQRGYYYVGVKKGDKSKNVLAHRFMYEREYGEIPPEMIVRHYVCDNPACCNPKHLKVGTHKDNAKDKMLKGRHQHNLSEETVLNILFSAKPYLEMEKEYGVNANAISNIKNMKTWRHISSKYILYPLSAEDIINIYLSRLSVDELADEFNCSKEVIKGIKQDKYYTEITKHF